MLVCQSRWVKLMNCLTLDTKGKPRCMIATKTVWASPLPTSAPRLASVTVWRWGEQNGAWTCRHLALQICARGSNFPFALWQKRQRSLGSVCLRTAFDPYQECNGTEGRKKREKAMQTKWEAQAPHSYLISINGFTGDPRDPRKSLRGGFSWSCL